MIKKIILFGLYILGLFDKILETPKRLKYRKEFNAISIGEIYYQKGSSFDVVVIEDVIVETILETVTIHSSINSKIGEGKRDFDYDFITRERYKHISNYLSDDSLTMDEKLILHKFITENAW